MGILSFFRNRRDASPSAAVAKGRLQVLIAHERTNRNGPEYLPQLKQDIVDVIKKYVNVGEDQVMVKIDSQDNREVLELNITLPEDSNETIAAAAASADAQVSSARSSANGNGNGNGSSESSKASDTAKPAVSTTSASSQNGKGNGNGKKSSKSSGKKNKGNKKSRRK